jgi:hypothetical protein
MDGEEVSTRFWEENLNERHRITGFSDFVHRPDSK